jgi:hypothetical protein
MKIITEILLSGELKQRAVATFGNLVKAVVDINKDSSKQKNLWGINL